MREEARLWLKQAEADLKTAEKLLEGQIFYASVFFSHQCGEESLKALWIQERQGLPPKTHNLVMMVRELGGDEFLIDAAAELAPEYILTRYITPEVALPLELYSERSARIHLDAARSIFDWASAKMKG